MANNKGILTLKFNSRFHVRNNPAAAKRDKVRPCKVCGWSRSMAIHDEANFGTVAGWSHPYADAALAKVKT
jgi:hypothetical protein